jgi:hypothetical protein
MGVMFWDFKNVFFADNEEFKGSKLLKQSHFYFYDKKGFILILNYKY